MSYPPTESIEVELGAMAREFLDSQYAGSHFTAWPIDRRLDAYLRRRGLSAIADDGTLFTSLLDQVMINIPLVRKGSGGRRPES